jgi:hypothetical protein
MTIGTVKRGGKRGKSITGKENSRKQLDKQSQGEKGQNRKFLDQRRKGR